MGVLKVDGLVICRIYFWITSCEKNLVGIYIGCLSKSLLPLTFIWLSSSLGDNQTNEFPSFSLPLADWLL